MASTRVERVRHIAVADVGEGAFRVEHGDVELTESGLDPRLLARQLTGLVAQARGLGLESRQLATDEVEPDRGELGDDAVVATRGVGLLLERPEPATDLAEEVVQPEQVALGRLEPALGLLAALAVLEDPRGLLDHGAPVLRARR